MTQSICYGANPQILYAMVRLILGVGQIKIRNYQSIAMNQNDDLIIRITSVIIRSMGLCIIIQIPVTLLTSIMPGGEDGYGDKIANAYLLMGVSCSIIELAIGIILWKMAKPLAMWLCRGL